MNLANDLYPWFSERKPEHALDVTRSFLRQNIAFAQEMVHSDEVLDHQIPAVLHEAIASRIADAPRPASPTSILGLAKFADELNTLNAVPEIIEARLIRLRGLGQSDSAQAAYAEIYLSLAFSL